MSRNPNITAHYVNVAGNVTDNFRKYIIHGSTPNDTKLDFTQEQRALIPRVDMSTYDWPVYPAPNCENTTYETDLVFFQIRSPAFDLKVEKIKICLHQPSTYGCIKVNVWDFQDGCDTKPINICNVNVGQDDTLNCPVTLIAEEKLISNALDNTDIYMINSNQECTFQPFDYTIAANSLLRMGIQYAEGNAYGLKVFIVGWALECNVTVE